MKFLSFIALLIFLSSSLVAQADEGNSGILYPLDTFTVKLRSQGGEFYLKTDVYAEVASKKVIPNLKEKSKNLKNTTIKILSSATPEYIRTEEGKTSIKHQMVKELNKHLNGSPIKQVYFDNFMIL